VISEVVMPQMGADMTEGTLVRWLKQEGDAVERGEIIAEIETDKANVEIEAFESGIFRKVLVPEGQTVDVGTVIAVIASPEEDLSGYEGAAVAAKAPAAKAMPASAPAAASAPPASTRVDGRVRASPVARKLAQEKGVDLALLRGTGPDGRIVRRDVEAAFIGGTAAPAPAAAPSAPTAPAPLPGAQVVPMSRMRQTIARRMTQSKQQAPHYYVTVDIDMAEAEHERREINNAFKRKDLHVSINDLIVKACAMALARHPIFNSWFVDGQVQQHESINVCIAIALEDGLIAPAILDCQEKSLAEIAGASRSLAERAKSGALRPEEYSGGTFTISNLGPYDIETLIAIIQPPQAAILGVGSVREVPVVREGQIVAGKLMKVALSADHRVTDGAQGAQFLNEIRKLLENPAALLI
jgi:pyruvate dehydrogenase E2 component (dihydrolipoamide acetyltransferase)